ncbi:MAG: hypothetical protein CMK59_09190 [Proteobacteria bacterium]|nr:hypothetical protein [Pseudomonadota bacterium]
MSKNRRLEGAATPKEEQGEPSDVTMRIEKPYMNSSSIESTKHIAIQVVAGRDMLSFFVIKPNSHVLIGREEHAELRLLDRAVSTRHAMINCSENGSLTIIDLASTNGTFVNDLRVDRASLQTGDYLEIGDVALRVMSLSENELQHLKRVSSRLKDANKDPLTGLYRRNFLDEELPKLVARCELHNLPISCCFVDLDQFKPINDTFGHQVGDQVLINIARIIMLTVRDGDTCIRYGGDELVLIFPGITEATTVSVVNRIRHNIQKHDWTRIAPKLAVSASFGVSTRKVNESIEQWMYRADQAVYAAKTSGRNRVIPYGYIEQIAQRSKKTD